MPPPSIEKYLMRDLLLIRTTETPINFDDQVCIQKDGVSMGGPLGPTFADYYMASTENTLLSQDKASIPNYYKRYVEEILAVFSKTSHVKWFKTRLKSLNILNCTQEEFNDSNVHFLDICLKIADDGSYHTFVYINPTVTVIYSNFNSYTLDKYKISVVKNLVHISLKSSSSWKAFDSDIKGIRETPVNNEYHLYTVDSIIKLRSTTKQILRKPKKICTKK